MHDIVMEVIRATGFAKGLHNEMKSDSVYVTSREQKIEFLEKIITLVGTQLNTFVEANPTEIVSGLEPLATNAFLQLLAVAAKHMPDSTTALKTVLEQGDGARKLAANASTTSSARAEADPPPPRGTAPSVSMQKLCQQSVPRLLPLYLKQKDFPGHKTKSLFRMISNLARRTLWILVEKEVEMSRDQLGHQQLQIDAYRK